MKIQHLNLPIKVPKAFRGEEHYDVQCIRQKVDKPAARVVIVLDHVPTEDLKSGKLLSGGTGGTINRVMHYAATAFKTNTHKMEDLDLLFVNWNCWKTYTMSEERRQESDSYFAERVLGIIDEYGADYVVTCGRAPFQHLGRKYFDRAPDKPNGWLGNSLPMKTPEGRTVRLIPNLSINSLLNSKSITSSAYLLGYYARNFLPIFNEGKMPFKIKPVKTGEKRNWNMIVVDTMKKFHLMMKVLRRAKYVAIDTETDGLHRINVNMLTLQFSADGETSYVLPFMHNDSPFTSKQLEEIQKTLQAYFEYDNRNRLHIYTNAKFDLNILRNCIKVRSFVNNVWDIIAGDFAMDENLKVLSQVTGHWYYSLANLSMQYGCTAYLEANFGKQNRAMIKDVPLDDDVCEYAALDTIIPWRIAFQQMKKAASMGYEKYQSVVGEQISDQIHTFSTLEHTGAATDVDYLFRLSMPDSPINSLLHETVQKFKDTDEVARTDSRLKKRANVPEVGLFGKIKDRMFKLSSREHLQTLFFDVMKLEPVTVSETKMRDNGKPEAKIDKPFQEKYKDNPVVAMYTSMTKLLKLRNAYVKSLIKKFGEDIDFNTTKRLRATYNYDRIVTGRTSANDPNLQQVPSRGPMAKYIKRLLISTMGYLVIKVDYSAHEVRGWSIISGDQGVADVFEQGAKLRRQYRLVPDPYIAKRLEYEGDVHKINAAYFFGIPIYEVVKDIRNAVKTVIFGLIYQQGDEGLANSTKRPVEEIVDIKARFLNRFPIGLKWFDKIKNFARKNYFVESPLGRRRNLFAFLLDETLQGARSTISRSERQSVNSPVQGFGSDLMMSAIRMMERRCFDHWKEHGVWPDIRFCISVHDSLSVEAAYDWVWFAIKIIEECMTKDVAKEMERRHGMKFTSIPEIDFEIGGSEATVKSWDFSYAAIRDIFKASLEFKRDELGDKQLADPKTFDRILDSMMEDQYDLMPEWMQQQLWANGIKIRSMCKENPLDEVTRRRAKKWRQEISTNEPLLQKIIEDEERAKNGGAKEPEPKKKRRLKRKAA